MINFELIIDVDFDVLDAAINECLPGFMPSGWVEFNRQTLTFASVNYSMYLNELGDLGSLIIRKIGEKKSIIDFYEPKRPNIKYPSPEQWKNYDFSGLSHEERLSKKMEVLEKCSEEAEVLFQKRKSHQTKIINALFTRLKSDLGTRDAFEKNNDTINNKDLSIEDFRNQLIDFRDLVERQLYVDILSDKGSPQEKFARSILQAYLIPRTYREVPVKGGRSDLLCNLQDGRVIIETKIWRGEQNFIGGINELSEYIVGENDDEKLLGAFYIVFDPTKDHQAQKHYETKYYIYEEKGFPIHIIIVNICQDTPSKKSHS